MKNILWLLGGVVGLVCVGALLAFSAKIDLNEAYCKDAKAHIDAYKRGMEPALARRISVQALDSDPVLAAMMHRDRPQKDFKDDKVRRVWEVLHFTSVRPGESVFEMEAGSGFYTELLSYVVGGRGKVIMQNPPEFDAFMDLSVLEARLGKDGKRLSNVRVSKSHFDHLDMPDNSVDLVTWFLGPHELWMKNDAGQMTLGDPEKTYAEIYRILKPGGRFVALDKISPDFTLEEESSETHKISPKYVTAHAEAAGFVLVKTSDVLSNKAGQNVAGAQATQFDINVIDPGKRVSTDRFLHLYRKPE